jgi:hypothetical protein
MPCTQTSFLASMGGDENKTLLFAVHTAPLDEDLPGVVRVPYNHAPIEVFTEVDAQRYRISSSLRGTIPRARHVVVVRTPHYRRGETSRLTWWATLVVHRGGRGGTTDEDRVLRKLPLEICQSIVMRLRSSTTSRAESPLLKELAFDEEMQNYDRSLFPGGYDRRRVFTLPGIERPLRLFALESTEVGPFMLPRAEQDAATAPLPSLEETTARMASDWVLSFMLRTIHAHMALQGCGGVDLFRENIVGDPFGDAPLGHMDYDRFEQLEGMDGVDLAQRVPYLRRLGFHVWMGGCDQSYVFTVAFPGRRDTLYSRTAHAEADRATGQYRRFPQLCGRAPAYVRALGVVKCVPALLSWLRRARIALAAPDRSGGLAAVAEFERIADSLGWAE